MTWLLAIPVAFLAVMLAEYVAHRWVMHRGWLSRRHYQWHHIEHHALGENEPDPHLDLNVGTNALIALAVTGPFAYWWPQLFLVTMGLAIVHSILWTGLHRSFHGCGGDWTRKLPVWSWLYWHHMRHHANTKRCYGAVFGPVVDMVFRTN